MGKTLSRGGDTSLLHGPQPFGGSSQGFSFFISWPLSLCRFPMVGLL